MKKFTGGLRIGESYWRSINYSWPLASFEIKEKSIGIKALFCAYDIPFTRIKSITLHNGLFGNGLRVEHTDDKVPPFIVFGRMNNRELIAELYASNLPFNLALSEFRSYKKQAPVSKFGCVFFIARTVLVFMGLLIYELARPISFLDALLNAFVFTIIITIVSLIFQFLRSA